MSRPDLMFCIGVLARQVTRWTALSDRLVHRLFGYLKGSVGFCLKSVIDRRDLKQLSIGCYPDADHAGCPESAKSTSGGWSSLEGAGTAGGFDWYSKRQGCVSHSTTEAELVSADKVLRECALPTQGLWRILLNYSPKIVLHEDNNATITVVASGYSQQLRYLERTHRVSLAFVHERCNEPDCEMIRIDSDLQKGDLFTKSLDKNKLDNACKLIGLG